MKQIFKNLFIFSLLVFLLLQYTISFKVNNYKVLRNKKSKQNPPQINYNPQNTQNQPQNIDPTPNPVLHVENYQNQDLQTSNNTIKDFSKEFDKLFNTKNGTSKSQCNSVDFAQIERLKLNNSFNDINNQGNFPYSKKNPYDKKYGTEDVSYLFDFLDPLLLKPVIDIFKKIENKAISAPIDNNLKDYYDPQLLAGLYSNNSFIKDKSIDLEKLAPFLKYTEIDNNRTILENNDNYSKNSNQDAKKNAEFESSIDGVNPKLLDKDKEKDLYKNILAKIDKNYDTKDIHKSVRMSQLSNIINMFNIRSVVTTNGWQKLLLDEFDFDGDGRLSSEELLFMIIWKKKDNLDDTQLELKPVLDEFIDPIFSYIDCNSDGWIEAEQIFNSLKDLKRPTNAYNIYKCNYKGIFYRTPAVNDFVLKNMTKLKGFIDLEEFRLGILLGILGRQVHENDINEKSNYNMKDLRWDKNGETDVSCSAN